MSQVGAFLSLRKINRQTIPGPANPLDKSTLVSIYPKSIEFKNITLMPGNWNLSAGSPEKPAVLVIGPSSWWKDVHPDEPLIEIPQSSVQIAHSLIQDYCNGLFGCNMGDAMPGMFFVPGEHTVKDVRERHGNLLISALIKQTNYYRSLIKFADSIWARSNGNPLTINDEMRVAARTLGVPDKEWMKDFSRIEQVRCFACGSFKNPEYPVCSSCKSIDPEHPKAKEIKFAV